jgi:hypothetical protein
MQRQRNECDLLADRLQAGAPDDLSYANQCEAGPKLRFDETLVIEQNR